MRAIQWIHGVVTLIIFSGAIVATAPISAQTPGAQSDIQGGNVWNNTAPQFGTETGLDPAIIDTARQISQQLDDAYAACTASLSAASTGPRRFALGPADNDEACISPECQSLERLLQEARTFLSSLDPEQAEVIQFNPNYRIW